MNNVHKESKNIIGNGLTDQLYAHILELLEDKLQHNELTSHIENLHPADLAILLERLQTKQREQILLHIPEDKLGDTITELHGEMQEAILALLSPEDITTAVDNLESDDKVDLVQALENENAESAENLISKEEAPLLIYEEDTAGGIMQVELLALPGDWRIGDVLEYIREHSDDLPQTLHRVFVVGYKMKHLGSISISRLVRQPIDVKLSDVIREDSVTVKPEMDQEDVARLFEKYDLLSCAVVDHKERLLGIITIDDILDVIIEEQDEDVMRAAGLNEGQDLFSPIFTTSLKRFPWLFINLVTAILASFVIAQFEGAISQIVALAVLMPIVASMGGNAGTQAMTITVRGLAMKQLTTQNARNLLWKEICVGSFNGIILAALVGLGTLIIYDNKMLGIVILCATIVNHILAALAGILIPIILEKCGKDPAISSTVLLTTVTDIGGFFTFLGLAAMLLL